jgi:hypothetical protein
MDAQQLTPELIVVLEHGQIIPAASRPIKRPRYRGPDFVSDLPLSASGKYSRRNLIEGKCSKCPRKAFGHHRCRTHRQSASEAAQRSRRRHPKRVAQRNRERREAYAKWRARGYSPAESRIYSGSSHWGWDAPGPQPIIALPKKPVWREHGPRVPKNKPRSFLELQESIRSKL